MKQIQTNSMKSVAPLSCDECGGLMRLVGSEPHLTEANTDLLTYTCTSCGGLKVIPVPVPTPMA
jgi:hypothetical protein